MFITEWNKHDLVILLLHSKYLKGTHVHTTYNFIFINLFGQVTGDNVCSLALCDFNGDGENEVRTFITCIECMHDIACTVQYKILVE